MVRKIRKRLSYDGSMIRGINFSDSPSLTQQQYKEECDLVKQINRLAVYGDPSGLVQNNKKPMYGDFSEIPDFITAHNTIIEANRMFMDLPSKVRKEFDNDPAKLIEFVSDSKNYDKAVELGLIKKVENILDVQPKELTVSSEISQTQLTEPSA